MFVLYVIVIIVINVLCTNCDINSRGNGYEPLPPIFLITDYEKCKAEGKLFCKVSINLMPDKSQNISYYWNIIEESVKDQRAYNHNELYHAICADDTCPDMKTRRNVDEYREILSKCYTKKYEDLGLAANITQVNCSKHDKVYKAGGLDFIWLLFLAIYGSYILFASVWDYRQQKQDRKKCAISKYERYIIPFSMLSNWRKLRRPNSNPEFQRLKSIQGIRFYNMLLIVFCHTYSSFIGGYVLNTSYIENIPNNPVRLGIRNLLVFLVQTFFLFSAFLLSYHIFQIMDHTRKFNIRIILLTFLNRYLRIIPPVLIMIGYGSTIWIVQYFYGPIKDQYSDLEYKRCQKNWWTTLLFINNHYNQYDMCYFITWYLAADTQLYVLSLILLSVIWKFRQKTKPILISCVFIGILIPAVISYIYELDIIYRITPENSKNNKFRSFTFNAIYSSTYANMATYMIGICMGCLYYRHNNYVITTTLHKFLWWATFTGLPILVIVASSYYYSRFYSALLCGILKPTYALGIGIGVLGMSQKLGGMVKSVCEWKHAIFMGNLTYSTYLVHYGIVFYRTATAKQPLFVSDFVLLTSFLYDAVVSFLCGFLMHILVEMPASQLQNMLVPQVRRQRQDSQTSSNSESKTK